MRKLLLLLAPLLLVNIISCRQDFDPPTWDADLVAPIAKASLDIYDFVEAENLEELDNQSLQLVFEDTIFQLAIDSLFTIPDTTISNEFSVPINGVQLPPGIIILDDTTRTSYDLDGVELTRAIVREGEVSVELASDIDEAIIVTYSIPLATLNGAPIQLTDTIPANGTVVRQFDLAGYELNLTGLFGNRFNRIETVYLAQIDPNGQTVTVNANEQFQVSNTFTGIVPAYVEGYFSDRTISFGPETTELDLLRNITPGTLDLDEMSIELGILNGLGLDLETELLELSTSSSVTGASASLSSSILGDPFHMNRAVDVPSQGRPVTPRSITFDLNSDNSNIEELVETLPDQFGYALNLQLNPLGNVSAHNDFAYYDNGLELYLRAAVPLKLAASGLTLRDTADFDFGTRPTADEDYSQEVNGGFLYAYTDNGFPFTATLQLTLLDSLGNVLDSLISSGNAIESGVLSQNLRVAEATRTRVAFPVTQERIDLLYAADRIEFRVTFDTAAQPQLVKLFSFYTLDVTLVGDVNYTVNIDKLR